MPEMSRITSFARVAVAYEPIVSRRYFAHFRRDSYRGLGVFSRKRVDGL